MRQQVAVVDIVVMRIGEKIGHKVAYLAQINRKLMSIHRTDGVFFGKRADFFITSSIMIDGLWRLVR